MPASAWSSWAPCGGPPPEVEHLSEEFLGGAPLLVHDQRDRLDLPFGEGYAGVFERSGQGEADLVERVLDHQSPLLPGERGTGDQNGQQGGRRDSCQRFRQ